MAFRFGPILLQKEKGPKFLIVKCRNSCPRFRRPDGAMREERESLLDFRFFFFFYFLLSEDRKKRWKIGSVELK